MSGLSVDASAIVSILALADGWTDLSDRLERSRPRYTSAIAVWEATAALTRLRSSAHADEAIAALLAAAQIDIVAIMASTGHAAAAAHRRYGRGRRPARLNMGDGFSYACAKALGVPLLYKGGDMALTDIATV